MKEFKLPKAFAEKWIADLRSGKYKQTEGALYNEFGNGFCCLGVACITAGYEIKDLKTPVGDFATMITVYSEEEGNKLYDLEKDLPNVPEELKGKASANRLAFTLSKLNDKANYSFNEIADWLEENVEFYGES